jgi:hypothetical protein
VTAVANMRAKKSVIDAITVVEMEQARNKYIGIRSKAEDVNATEILMNIPRRSSE